MMPNADASAPFTAGTAEQRVADIEQAFADPDIDGLVCSIGGTLSSQLLDRLDYGLIADNPKVFCGYSDVTTLHCAFGKLAGLSTFYGPALLPEWGELPQPAVETASGFLAATASTTPIGTLAHPLTEIVEHVDWSEDRPRRSRAAPPPVAVAEGTVTAPLISACPPVLRELVGTPWMPELSGTVLHLDLPEHPYRALDLLTDLTHLHNCGVLGELAGLVVSRPHLGRGVGDVEQALRLALQPHLFPAVLGIACGHTAPTLTLPQGAVVELSGTDLRVLTPGVS